MLLVTASASAHFDHTSWYTYDNDTCSGEWEGRVDPLNVVFYDSGTWWNAENQISAHAGWHDGSGSPQWFRDHNGCHFRHTQRASAGPGHSRYHIRIKGQHADQSLGWTASGDAHYEDVVDCDGGWGVSPGHAVRENSPTGSGFDMARDELAHDMGFDGELDGHDWHFAWRGNTRSFKQCDEQYASSDGAVAWISLHPANH